MNRESIFSHAYRYKRNREIQKCNASALAKNQLFDLVFPSPLIFSSFQSDLNQIAMWLDLGIGGGSFKTILKEPRDGNERPRLTQLSINNVPHLLNAQGLPGKGVHIFSRILSKSKLWEFKRPFGMSLGGNTPEEYWDVFLELEKVLGNKPFARQYYYEINISCPNTHEGKDFLSNPEKLDHLLTMMRDKTDRVIGVKLSPDQSNEDIVSFALRIQKISRTFLVIGNTQFYTKEQLGLSPSTLTTKGGGLSGLSLFKRTLEMADLVSPLGIPFVSVGGIQTAKQVQTCLDKGATLVGMATGLVFDPYCIPKINKKLVMKRYNESQ